MNIEKIILFIILFVFSGYGILLGLSVIETGRFRRQYIKQRVDKLILEIKQERKD